MKRVLIGFIVDGKAGGLDKYLLNFIESVWNEDVQIDFLTNEIDEELQKHLKQYHSRLFPIARLVHPFKQYRQICKIIRQGNYDTVYLNSSTAIECIGAVAAKHCHVEKRIIHSHASGNDCGNRLKRMVYNFIHRICRLFLYRMGTEFYACSRNAGLWMFPKKIVDSSRFHVLLSGIDEKQYEYMPEIREEMRDELNIKDKFVVGHIGTFTYVKNHQFLLKIFAEIKKQCPQAVLMLVGDGETKEYIRALAEQAGIGENVLFLGWRNDTAKLVQAMDVFILPSHFEGLSIVSLEAQRAKVPCIVSTGVPEEIKISNCCDYLSLKKTAGKWAEKVLEYKNYRKADFQFIESAHSFDIREQKKIFENML